MITRANSQSPANRQPHSTKGAVHSRSRKKNIRTKKINKFEPSLYDKFVTALDKGQKNFVLRPGSNSEDLQKQLDHADKKGRQCTFYIHDTIMNKTLNIHNHKLIGSSSPNRRSLLKFTIELNCGNLIDRTITGTLGRQAPLLYAGDYPPLIETDSETFTGDSIFLSGQNGQIKNIAVKASLFFPFIKYASGSELSKIKKPVNIGYLNTDQMIQEVLQRENSWSKWTYKTSSAAGNAVSDCYQACSDCCLDFLDCCEYCLRIINRPIDLSNGDYSSLLFDNWISTPSPLTTQPSSFSSANDTCPAGGDQNTRSTASLWGGNSTEN